MRSLRRTEMLAMLKITAGCHDCFWDEDPDALEFDHTGEKHANIGAMRQCSLAVLFAEIERCEVVCCRCHRVRSRKRLAAKLGA